MADLKISQLTAAATPLAGTEVLPIVQSNSTVKVSIADVTAGRAVSATSITAGLGTVGAPTYTFAGDTNTGMWSPAADTIAFSEGGAESMRITSAGNVGIGTSSPAVPLEVAGDIRSLGLYQRVNDSGLTLSGGTTFSTGAGIALRGVASGYNTYGIEFYTGGSERARIDSNGNVGIGTSSPDAAARLDVSSTTSGFLPPRMTEAQRDLIASPPNGLVLYNTTTNKLQVRAAGVWVDLH